MITCLPPPLSEIKVSDSIWNRQYEEFCYRIPKKLDENAIAEEEFDFVSDEDEFESDEEDEWIDEPESTNDLLQLASSASNDIHNFFHRNKGNEDFCDIFQDRFKSIKSGRELYYADLVAVAQFGSDGVNKRSGSRKPSQFNNFENEHTITTPSGKTCRCHLPHKGVINTTIGLGPFQQLFDIVLRDSLIKETKEKSHNKNLATFSTRKLPESFWQEPGSTNLRNLNQSTQHRTLDFDDLLADWTTDNSNYV